MAESSEMSYNSEDFASTSDDDTESSSTSSYNSKALSDPLRPHIIYQRSETRRRGRSQLFSDRNDTGHRCPAHHVLTGVLALCKKLWKNAVKLTVTKRVQEVGKYITNLAEAPVEDVPILFSVIGSSSRADASQVFDVFERHLTRSSHENGCGQGAPSASREITVERISSSPKTVYELVTRLTMYSHRHNRFMQRASQPVRKRGTWLADFVNFMSPVKECPTTRVIIIDDVEHMPSSTITTLIRLCHQLRLGSCAHLASTPEARQASTHQIPWVPICLVLGASMSTVQAIQLHWPSDVLLKTVSTSAQAFSVREAVRYAADTLLSHLTITSLLEIPKVFLSTLVDDVNQFSRSLEIFRRHVQLYIATLFALVSPFLTPLLAPVRLQVMPSSASGPSVSTGALRVHGKRRNASSESVGCITIQARVPASLPLPLDEEMYNHICKSTSSQLHASLKTVYTQLVGVASEHQVENLRREPRRAKRADCFKDEVRP